MAVRPEVHEVEMSLADLDAARAAYNPRVMPEHEAAALKTSIERFGLVQPLIWNARTNRLVGGHQRLDALLALGETRTKVIVVDLDEWDEKALNLALNKVHGEWDWPKLEALLDELAAANPELPGFAGFTADELRHLEHDGHLLELRLQETKQSLKAVEAAEAAVIDPSVDDAGPEEPPERRTTRSGDLWLLGDHRLLCGDSTKPEQIERVLAGDRPVLMATDPPYCVDYTGTNRPSRDGKAGGKDWTDLYREIDIADLSTFLDSFFAAVLPHLASNAPIYVWHAHVQQPAILATFEKHGLLFHQVIIWVKPTGVFGHSFFQWRHEPAAFGWRKGHKPDHGQAQLDTVWECDWDGKARFSTFHPTSKPPKLFEIPMALHTRPGDVVFEGFSGSGSQIIAAERLCRRCRAIELSPAFVDGTVLRWQKATGKEARLEEDGRTFAEVAAARALESAAGASTLRDGTHPLNSDSPASIATKVNAPPPPRRAKMTARAASP